MCLAQGHNAVTPTPTRIDSECPNRIIQKCKTCANKLISDQTVSTLFCLLSSLNYLFITWIGTANPDHLRLMACFYSLFPVFQEQTIIQPNIRFLNFRYERAGSKKRLVITCSRKSLPFNYLHACKCVDLVYTTLTNFSTINLMMCKVYTNVDGIK